MSNDIERGRFEFTVRERYTMGYASDDADLFARDGNDYVDDRIAGAWQGWQARAALAAPKQEPICWRYTLDEPDPNYENILYREKEYSDGTPFGPCGSFNGWTEMALYAAPSPPAAPVLSDDAQVGGTVFRPGVKEQTVIEAAKRHYKYRHDKSRPRPYPDSWTAQEIISMNAFIDQGHRQFIDLTEYNALQREHAAIRAAALEEAARACETLAEQRFSDYGTREHDTNATYYKCVGAENYETRDEEDSDCAEAIRALLAKARP